MNADKEYLTPLREAVKAAVRRTVAAFREARPNERLNGYALVTDDGLGTLGHFISSDQFLASQDPSARYEPVDWIYNDGVEAFDEEAHDILTTHGDGASSTSTFAEHVVNSFRALVEALRDLRGEGLFDDGVFLTVISTDPNEQLLRLEEEAVRELNSRELFDGWKATR